MEYPSQHNWLSGQPQGVQKAFRWVEKNAQMLLYGALGIIVVAAIWGGTSYFQERQLDEAASLFAGLPTDPAQREAGLAGIASEYPDTGAGIAAIFDLGRKAYNDAQYDQAASWFEKLTSLSDNQAMVRILAQHNLAAVNEAKGDWEQALNIYQKAAADPANRSVALTYFHLGRTCEAMQKWSDARAWYEKSVDAGLGSGVAEQAKERLLWLDISQSSS